VHLDLSPSGELNYTHIVEGDTTREALTYVQYEVQDLNERLRLAIEKALRENRLTEIDAAKLQRRYKEALEGYTYLYVDP
jgi:arginine decarboxylase